MRRETKKCIKELSIHSGLTWKIFFPGMKCNRGEGTEILQISANVVSLSFIHESYQKWKDLRKRCLSSKCIKFPRSFMGVKWIFILRLHAGRGQYPPK